MTAERLPPPSTAVGPLAWLRANLFGSPASTLLTLIMTVIVVAGGLLIADWAINHARWGVVTNNLKLFLVGLYPFEELWRVWVALLVLSVLTGYSAGAFGGAPSRTLSNWLAAGQATLALLALVSAMSMTTVVALGANAAVVWLTFMLGLRLGAPRRLLTFTWIGAVIAIFYLLQGARGTPLELVPTNLWGGLLLTFMLAIVGIVASFPLGVLLALGRRSDMRAVSLVCTVFIEVVRGVPLITILFMARIVLPLFLPGDLRIEDVYRAMAGLTLFSAAYVAENVRGGLQAIPSGQVEAAQAVGLNPIQTTLYIVLPQALRAVIPANVGLFISLLKDTTLVYIVALLELLGIGRAVLAQAQWFGACASTARPIPSNSSNATM